MIATANTEVEVYKEKVAKLSAAVQNNSKNE